jgi:hypothetical protein
VSTLGQEIRYDYGVIDAPWRNKANFTRAKGGKGKMVFDHTKASLSPCTPIMREPMPCLLKEHLRDKAQAAKLKGRANAQSDSTDNLLEVNPGSSSSSPSEYQPTDQSRDTYSSDDQVTSSSSIPKKKMQMRSTCGLKQLKRQLAAQNSGRYRPSKRLCTILDYKVPISKQVISPLKPYREILKSISPQHVFTPLLAPPIFDPVQQQEETPFAFQSPRPALNIDQLECLAELVEIPGSPPSSADQVH